jgi:hypothetical protein
VVFSIHILNLICNRYIGAQVPRRAAALLRKRAIIEGTYGSFDLNSGTDLIVSFFLNFS